MVVYIQILIFIEFTKTNETRNITNTEIVESKEVEINTLPQPPIQSKKLKNVMNVENENDNEEDEEDEEDGDNEEDDDSENDEIKKKEFPIEDPVLLTYNSITQSTNLSSSSSSSYSSKYILISINGNSTSSSHHLIDTVSILTTLFPPQQQQREQREQELEKQPYILFELNSSLNYRTIQYLLSKFPKLYFTVDGRVTHTKQKQLREYLFDIPLERIVIESNSPLYPPVSPPSYSEYPLPPLPDISPSYHPGYLLIIAATIGSVKRITNIDEILDVCWENTCKILGLK